MNVACRFHPDYTVYTWNKVVCDLKICENDFYRHKKIDLTANRFNLSLEKKKQF